MSGGQIALFGEGDNKDFKTDFIRPNNIIQPHILDENIYVGFDFEKSPINLKNGCFAKSTDPKTWVDFKTAKTLAPNLKNVIGIGIILGETPYGVLCGFDIDNCIDENGNICYEAQEIIDKFDTYTEISIGGKGLHLLFFAVKKTSICKLSDFGWCDHIELYDNRRYFTLSGNIINNKPIKYCQSYCDWLVEKYFKPKEEVNNINNSIAFSYSPNEEEKPKSDNKKSDEEYFEIGLKNCPDFRDLYNGKRLIGDESRDDMKLIGAMMYWCNNNIGLIKRKLSESQYIASKDDKHKKKMQRKDYLDMTIKNIKNESTARRDDELYWLSKKNNEKSSKNKQAESVPLNKIQLLTKGISNVKNAPKYDWIVEGMFARQHTSIIFGEPGCCKTWLMLYISLILTTGGVLWKDLTVKQSKVLFFEGDTPVSTLNERITKLNKPLNDDYFKYVSRYDADEIDVNLSLCTEDGRNNFESFIKNFMPDLIVIDTLISFIDDEKDAEQIKKVIDFLKSMAVQCNCHVTIVHHSRKRDRGEIRNKLDQSDVIGSSIITRLASIVIGVDKYDDKQ